MTAADWEAVRQAAQARVGQVSTRRLGRMSARWFERFAVASGESVRPPGDGEVPERGHPAAVAPPLFLTSVLGWDAGPDSAALRPDGAAAPEFESLPLDGLRLMGAGQELEFLRPVADGCEVTQEVSVEHVELKRGASGPLLLFVLLRRYLDQDGQELVLCRETFIAR